MGHIPNVKIDTRTKKWNFDKTGGYFAETTVIPSSFSPKSHHVPKPSW